MKGTPVRVVYRARGPVLGSWEDQPPAAYPSLHNTYYYAAGRGIHQLGGDGAGLLLREAELPHVDGRPLRQGGAERLGLAVRVLAHQRARDVEDAAGAAVVGLQGHLQGGGTMKKRNKYLIEYSK
eukprot:1196132-Prorocentrum_minimum.AAC.2